MTKQRDRSRLVEIKQSLANKYERRAGLTKSKPKQQQYLNRAESYREQARILMGKTP